MSYLLRRLGTLATHIRSLRGLLIALSAVAAIVAVVTADTVSKLAALVAIVTAGLLLLLMSARLSDSYGAVRRPQRVPDDGTRSERPSPTRSTHRVITVGPNEETIRAERIAQARRAIVEVRSRLAVGAARPLEQATSADEGADSIRVASPAVTVVVPCYNESEFLGATLESVRRQTFTDWECIVVDDASTDSSLTEAWRYAKADDRFRVVRHKANGGLSAARNTGLRMARGSFVTFLDSDDMLMADSLLDRIETMAECDETTAGVFCGVRIAAENTTLDSLPPHAKWGEQSFVDFVTAEGECPFNAHAPLLRTEIPRSVGGFAEDMREGAEDWNMWLRIMRRGYNFVPSKWRTAVYRQKRSSMAKTGAVGHLLEAQRQIGAAYRADPTVMAGAGAAHRFPEPLPVYQQQLTEARRALQYAATVLASGDRAAAEAMLSKPDLVIEGWMDRHLNFRRVINAGFRRALGLSIKEVGELADDIDPLAQILIDKIEEREPAPLRIESSESVADYDVLLIPQNGAQARAMLAGATGLGSDASIAFLNADRVSGTHGVAEVIAASPIPSFSLNQWVLGRNKHRTLVVSFPRDGVAEEFIATTVKGGGRVAEVVLDGTEVMEVAERSTYDFAVDRLAATGDLAAWLSDNREAAAVTIGGNERGALLWYGATDPDPDAAYEVEEYPETTVDSEDLARFAGIHNGERCVIIGNGPSLNQLDLRKLANEFTIGVNGIFYAADDMGFDPTYYVVEDTMVMRDNVEAIKAYSAGHKFFPSIYRDQVGVAPNVSYFMMNRGFYASTSPSFCIPRFSTDASQRAYSGQSVTIINLQLAYYMGFSEVVLIGMDFSYTVPEDSKVDGAHILSMGDDPNHFHPDYFGKGKIWKDPKLDRVLANYQLAKLMFEADGRRIVNATAGGKLELFDRVPYDELFG